jgi:hypothetical protein
MALYDARGAAEVEQFRSDKSGLSLDARRKHSFLGQKGYVLLNDLAHNLLSDFTSVHWSVLFLKVMDSNGSFVIFYLFQDAWYSIEEFWFGLSCLVESSLQRIWLFVWKGSIRRLSAFRNGLYLH